MTANPNPGEPGGPGGGAMPPIPYVFSIPNQRQQHTAIRNNIGPARAWRAPNHPASGRTHHAVLDDLAAKLNMDPIEFFAKNLNLTKARENTYREELRVGTEWYLAAANGGRDGARRWIVISYLGRPRARQS